MDGNEKIFQKVLIPVDGSSYSLAAIRLAGKLARIHNSQVTIVHVIDEQVIQQLCRFRKEECESIRKNMEEEAKGLVSDMKRELSATGIQANTVVLKGIPYEQILDVAENQGVDLIVMGKLGKRGVKRILIGSVAERVIEFSKCPVLSVSDKRC